ncbi:triacylglycerol lipase [Vibrio cholerae]
MNIVILHGLYMHGLAMLPLSQRLQDLGYDTKTVSYNSVAINEQVVFSDISSALSRHQPNVLVGHSLGGLIIKHYLESTQPSTDTISHVVAIGSPLQGASIATRIQKLGMGAILGNAPEFGLTQHEESVWRVPQKLGSIAGTLPVGARPLLMMDNSVASDGTVTLKETKIDGMTDHIAKDYSHTSLIFSRFVTQQIDHFIRYDHFNHTAVR